MKTKIIALAIFATTAIGIAVFPAVQQAQAINTQPITTQNHQIEVVFILDTTSSMSGLIQAAKEKIWSIATTMASAEQDGTRRISRPWRCLCDKGTRSVAGSRFDVCKADGP